MNVILSFVKICIVTFQLSIVRINVKTILKTVVGITCDTLLFNATADGALIKTQFLTQLQNWDNLQVSWLKSKA